MPNAKDEGLTALGIEYPQRTQEAKIIMTKSIQIILALIALAIAAPAHAQEKKGGTDEDYDAIITLHRSIVGHYNSGDLESFKNSYTEDAWHISMRRPMAQSREEIGKFFGPNMSAYEFEDEHELLELEVVGDTAIMIGRTSLKGFPRVEDESFPEFTENRIFTGVFKKVDDQWLIHRYMESTSPREGDPLPTPTGE